MPELLLTAQNNARARRPPRAEESAPRPGHSLSPGPVIAEAARMAHERSKGRLFPAGADLASPRKPRSLLLSLSFLMGSGHSPELSERSRLKCVRPRLMQLDVCEKRQ